ncbi:MAG TPA: V-type ATP synthase subunit D [bacterium]|nr:V-type ATP synthase subunit D [bacterium]
MRIAVNPNRMEYLKLRRRLILALRGYKLLKDKQDELMKRFQELVRGVWDKRKNLSLKWDEIYAYYFRDLGWHEGRLEYEQEGELEMKLGKEHLYNLRVPVLEKLSLRWRAVRSRETVFKKRERSVLETLLRETVVLGIEEKTVEIVAEELKKTRRRVNALKYILIPALRETIRYIRMRLDELERGNLVRLMKVKDIVRKHEGVWQ